ncbi:acyl-[acyl-carrier-protein] thioesterase [Porphyromonas pogonae]|uniref:acyl-[acyl-carrier-protein] thioesterase n=1 Tax=Porphyromonas pogonae TaxID=867595 RepID=UPI002E767BCF|nr:acyl-ACP thioesterase domain-containing protein [Porphyromonas pogonae]
MNQEISNIETVVFRIEDFMLDFRAQLPLTSLINYLIHTAGIHASRRGFGIHTLHEIGYTWVLSGLAVERVSPTMEPRALHISTWIEEINRLFTLRSFTVTDEHGNLIAKARSRWAAIGIEDRKPCGLDKLEGLTKHCCGNAVDIAAPGRIASPESCLRLEPFCVKYSDLDINRHLTTVKYVERMMDLFEVERYDTYYIRRFEILFLKECLYGEELSVCYEEISPDTYITEIKSVPSEDKRCRAKIIWGKR